MTTQRKSLAEAIASGPLLVATSFICCRTGRRSGSPGSSSRRRSARDYIPFAPFILAGAWVALFLST